MDSVGSTLEETEQLSISDEDLGVIETAEEAPVSETEETAEVAYEDQHSAEDDIIIDDM